MLIYTHSYSIGMNQKLVSEVVSIDDIKEIEELINNEKRKIQTLVLKISKGELDNKQIIDEILELDVEGGATRLLSTEVVN